MINDKGASVTGKLDFGEIENRLTVLTVKVEGNELGSPNVGLTIKAIGAAVAGDIVGANASNGKAVTGAFDIVARTLLGEIVMWMELTGDTVSSPGGAGRIKTEGAAVI